LDNIVHVLIIVLTLTTAYLCSRVEVKTRVKGYFLSIVIQPLWFYSSLKAQQYGILSLSFFYLAININAFLNHGGIQFCKNSLNWFTKNNRNQ
jgi:hypothetical protein